MGDGGSVAVSGTHAGVQAGTSATIPAGTDPAGDVTAAAGGSSVAGSDPVSGAANLVVASREAFREKFLLAIERGYGGSVTDE